MENIRQIPKTQNFTRMLARGIDFTDYVKMKFLVDKGGDFVNVCENLGDISKKHAIKELEKGHLLTARTFFMKAAAIYRVSHYEILQYTEEKKRIYTKELECFDKGVSLYDSFSAEKVEIPYKDSKMVGWLMIPKNAPKDVPVIVCTGGMTGFKEEVHYVTLSFLERGMAVLNLDGPGQGEAFHFHGCNFEISIEDAFETAVDYLINRSDVGSKIALYGLCMGGYLMARTATKITDKIEACVSMGGAFELATCSEKNPAFFTIGSMRAGRMHESEDARKDFASKLTLEGMAHKIKCPLLIIHNRPDYLITSTNVQRLYDEASSEDKEIHLFKGPDHNAHNDNTESVALAADWLAEKLINVN